MFDPLNLSPHVQKGPGHGWNKGTAPTSNPSHEMGAAAKKILEALCLAQELLHVLGCEHRTPQDLVQSILSDDPMPCPKCRFLAMMEARARRDRRWINVGEQPHG